MRKILITIVVLCIGFSSWTQNKVISLEDIWKNYSFYPDYVWGLKSMKNGSYYTQIDRKDNNSKLNKYSYRTGKRVSTIANSEKLGIPVDNYTFSEDEEKLLFATETENIYRYSKRSIYYIYNIRSRKLIKLSDDKLMHVNFSPDGSRLAYVKDNNLYLMDLSNMQETQITRDGVKNHIINGASDWVYEEEFALIKAFFGPQIVKKLLFIVLMKAR